MSRRDGSLDSIVVTKRLGETVLPDADGNDVRLADLWAERLVAFVWLRHYG